jgi:hypothetical protein
MGKWRGSFAIGRVGIQSVNSLRSSEALRPLREHKKAAAVAAAQVLYESWVLDCSIHERTFDVHIIGRLANVGARDQHID